MSATSGTLKRSPRAAWPTGPGGAADVQRVAAQHVAPQLARVTAAVDRLLTHPTNCRPSMDEKAVVQCLVFPAYSSGRCSLEHWDEASGSVATDHICAEIASKPAA